MNTKILLCSIAFVSCSTFAVVEEPPPPTAEIVEIPSSCLSRSSSPGQKTFALYDDDLELRSKLRLGLIATLDLICSSNLDGLLSSDPPWCDGLGESKKCPCQGTTPVNAQDLAAQILEALPQVLHVVIKDPPSAIALTRRRPLPAAVAIEPQRIALWGTSKGYLLVDTIAHELTHLVGNANGFQAYQDSEHANRQRMVSYRFGHTAACAYRYANSPSELAACAAVQACQ